MQAAFAIAVFQGRSSFTNLFNAGLAYRHESR